MPVCTQAKGWLVLSVGPLGWSSRSGRVPPLSVVCRDLGRPTRGHRYGNQRGICQSVGWLISGRKPARATTPDELGLHGSGQVRPRALISMGQMAPGALGTNIHSKGGSKQGMIMWPAQHPSGPGFRVQPGQGSALARQPGRYQGHGQSGRLDALEISLVTMSRQMGGPTSSLDAS